MTSTQSLAILAVLAAAGLRAAQVPTFDEFPTGEPFTGRPATPVIRTEFQKRFRTQILRESRVPANFAGHYRIAEWVSVAVINLRTGAVYDGPFHVLGYAVRRKYEGGEDELEYRLSSGLLIVRGCPEDQSCGTYYYAWRGDHFDRLRSVPTGAVIR
jgi:hypothetical protein